MASLFLGTEDISFTSSDGTVEVTTTSGYYDSNASRCSVSPTNIGAYLYTPTFTSQTDIWVHFVSRPQSFSSSAKEYIVLEDTSTGTLVAGLYTQASPDRVIRLQNGAAQAEEANIVTNTTHTFDIHFTLAATGIFKLYIDDSLVIDYSGDTTISGVSGVDRLRLYKSGFNTSAGGYFSEVIVDTVSTVGARLFTSYPNANGIYSEFTNTYTAIDEITHDTTDFITTDTVGNRFTANTANINAAFNSYDVLEVQQVTANRIASGSAVTDIQHLLRNNATDVASSNLGMVKDNSIQVKTTNYTTDPSTGLPWTIATADSAEFGIKTV